MLLLDNDAELPGAPSQAEAELAAALGAEAMSRVDETLCRHATRNWLKVARVVMDSMRAGGFPVADDRYVAIHVRRVIALTDNGVLEATGNPRQPRLSEVRLSR